jgi:hypothetical protein
VSRKRDIKQFDQACREVGLTEEEQYEASEAFWLGQWKED